MALRTDVDALAVLPEITCLESIYPGFRQWYLQRVVPGLADGSRLIVADVLDGGLAGIAIAKRTCGERKLCTLWRNPRLGRDATVAELLTGTTSWLGPRRPTFTVPVDRIHRLRPVLNEMQAGSGVPLGTLYRPGVSEMLFNASGMPE